MYNDTIKNLRKAAICSNGLFVVGQLFSNQKERNSFFMLKARHPDFFKEIFKGNRSAIYGLTVNFLNYYEVNTAIKEVTKKEEILKNLAWLPFCMAHDLDIPTPNNQIELNETYFIDPFNEGVSKYSGLKIITLPFRNICISISKNIPIIAIGRGKIWVSQTIEEYVFGQNLIQIKGSYIPLIGDNIHLDPRHYPGVKEKMTGIQKWELDKVFLNNTIALPKDYQIGIYR